MSALEHNSESRYRASIPYADGKAIRKLAMQSLFERLDSLCEGALAVDGKARIVWINEKYVRMLGLGSEEEALGREIEEIIPNSLMRQVVTTGEPILLDIMEFNNQSFVVTRMPIQDPDGRVIGAVGFVLYDRLNYLKPLVAKFARLQSEFVEGRRQLSQRRRSRYTLDDMVGTSSACQEIKRQVRRVAQLDTTVLLLGETGTGKELVAHAIHAASRRADKPFVCLNMAAVPEALLEAEFFGTAPGAFTGAERKPRPGKLQLADGGSLFLDEVGDMPLAMQAKVLRVLQEQEFEPLGSNQISRVDVRVITATSVDLRRMVAEGRFRSDLYYRLNVLPVHLPPLRERLSDLEALCNAILTRITERTGMPRREITQTGVARLARYEWPGNIRELQNVLEQAALLTDRTRLTADDFSAILPPSPLGAARGDPVSKAVSYREAIDAFEQQLIDTALARAGGKVDEAARQLGLARATLYKKIARFQRLSTIRDSRLTS